MRTLWTSVVEVVGVVLIVAGVAAVSVPAAAILAGGGLVAVGFRAS